MFDTATITDAAMHRWPAQPDIDATAKYYYSDTPQNYTRDPVLADWTKDARVELDPAKREEIYNKLFNRVAEERYTAAVVQFPSIVVQSQDLIFEDARILYTQGFALNRISWAK